MIHSSTTTPINFVMDYYQDMSAFWKSILIAFIIFQVFIALVISFRLYYFLKQNPRSLLKDRFAKTLTFKLLYLLFDVWSGIMFWILFFTTAYWFITYKLQSNAYVLLPSLDDWSTSYMVFDVIFGIVLLFRFLALLFAIIEQSNVDIFLIDWE